MNFHWSSQRGRSHQYSIVQSKGKDGSYQYLMIQAEGGGEDQYSMIQSEAGWGDYIFEMIQIERIIIIS